MKIHEYNEMMSYLTRPAMAYGGRIGFYNGGTATAPIVDYFQNKLGITLGGKESLGDLKEVYEYSKNLSEEKIKKTYDKLIDTFVKKQGYEFITKQEKQKIWNEAIRRLIGRKFSETSRKTVSFGKKDVILNPDKTPLFKDPTKEAQFLKDLEFRYQYPESSGGKSYAKEAGVLDQKGLQKKYFKDYSKKSIDAITSAVAKKEGWIKPTLDQYISDESKKVVKEWASKLSPEEYAKHQKKIDNSKIFTYATKVEDMNPNWMPQNELKSRMKNKGFKHYDDSGYATEMGGTSGQKKRRTFLKALDPTGVKESIVEAKKYSGIDTHHALKKTLLSDDPYKFLTKGEIMQNLMPVKKELNQGKAGGFKQSLIQIAETELEKINKLQKELIDSNTKKIISGKEKEMEMLNAKAKKIVRNFYKTKGNLLGTEYRRPGVVGKGSGLTNVRGLIAAEIFQPTGTGGIMESKTIGLNPEKSWVGSDPDPVFKKQLTEITPADKDFIHKKVF